MFSHFIARRQLIPIVDGARPNVKTIAAALAHVCGSGASRNRLVRVLCSPSLHDADFKRIMRLMEVDLSFLPDPSVLPSLDADAVDAAISKVLVDNKDVSEAFTRYGTCFGGVLHEQDPTRLPIPTAGRSIC